MREKQFYCVSCRSIKTVKNDDICVKIYKNKRMIGGKVPTLKAQCNCGTNMTKFIKHDDTKKMQDKYGKC